MPYNHDQIIALVEQFRHQGFDPHYLCFFECFNQQLFFEAHEVLELLWLPQRGRPEALFYQALIQLAGAFVHVQKQRPSPALSLFRLADLKFHQYPSEYESLDLDAVHELIRQWTTVLERQSQPHSPPPSPPWPRLEPLRSRMGGGAR